MIDNQVKSETRPAAVWPAVSVIVPVYNGMATLGRCLGALNSQDYRGVLETIVVDDGSTDDSGELARTRGARVIRQWNRGPALARNAGAEAARGEFLVFTDADCVPDEGFVSGLVKPLLGTDISGSQGIFYSTQRNLVARILQHEAEERYRREERAGTIDWVATYGACYRRDVFREAGGFRDIYSAEDVDLSFRLAAAGRRMVLAPGARCEHLNYESFWKYLRYKYLRGYWAVRLLRNHPGKAVRDPLTPWSRKAMMVLMAAGTAGFAAGIWWGPGSWIGAGAALGFIATTVPFAARTARTDAGAAAAAPLFLAARTAAYIAGFAKGTIDLWRGKERPKKSPVK